MIFWLVCAIFIIIALAFVLPTLLQGSRTKETVMETGQQQANVAVYRDQLAELAADLQNGIVSKEQYEQDRDEIERRLLEDVSGKPKQVIAAKPTRGSVYAIALALPVLAIGIYLRVGNPGALTLSAAADATSGQDSSQFNEQRIQANVASLAKRLEQNPDDIDGWIMLARSYTSLGRYADATVAYGKATAIKTDDAELWADYAFAMAMANGRKLQGQPLEFVNKALKLDPENAKALELAGSAAFEAKNYKQAIEYWQKLLTRTPADSDVGQALTQKIAEAKRLSAGQ